MFINCMQRSVTFIHLRRYRQRIFYQTRVRRIRAGDVICSNCTRYSRIYNNRPQECSARGHPPALLWGFPVSRAALSARARGWGDSPGGALVTSGTVCGSVVVQPPFLPLIAGKDGGRCPGRALAIAKRRIGGVDVPFPDLSQLRAPSQ